MVEVLDISKRFVTERGDVHALDRVSFDVPEGNLVTLLGASGCGKSTTLRCIAGLEQPESGAISIGGRTVYSADAKRIIPTEQRPIGMVFQSYAIWPHMTVFENVAYPLRGRGLSRSQVAQEANRVLSLVELREFGDRPAPQLSGGQQQRVALARALVANPRVLLLDEPLSNLDAKLRQQMRVEIRRLQQKTGITAIYVTHDQEEAMAVSDRILFMSSGQIVESGSPKQIYARPHKRLTAEFFGEANFLAGKIKGKEKNFLVVETCAGLIACNGLETETVGEQVSLFFRPEDVKVAEDRIGHSFLLKGTIVETVFLGKSIECVVEVSDGDRVKVSAHGKLNFQNGEEVYLAIDPDACSVLRG